MVSRTKQVSRLESLEAHVCSAGGATVQTFKELAYLLISSHHGAIILTVSYFTFIYSML